jgi:hypothetical protein
MPAEVELKRRALACVDIGACRAAKTANTWLSFCITPLKFLIFLACGYFLLMPVITVDRLKYLDWMQVSAVM